MDKDNVILFDNRELLEDPLTDPIRNRVKILIALAVEAEVNEQLAKFDDQHTKAVLQAVVRSSCQPEREIQAGIGAVDG